ncbi:unnamed protein product [Amaranthus hypochondriacus]
MVSDRERKGRKSASGIPNARTVSSISKVHKFHDHRQLQRHHAGQRSGHRGFTHPQWECGPREPPLLDGGRNAAGFHPTLFLDHLPRGISREWVYDIFSDCGKVDDTYISKKVRMNTSDGFGFVRYRKMEDARRAVEKFNGHTIKGLKLSVSFARYDKNGRSFKSRASKLGMNNYVAGTKVGIRYPSFRDKRQYVEVVKGKQIIKEGQNMNISPNKNPTLDKEENTGNHEQETLKVAENPTMAERLERAIVVEFEESLDMTQAASIISGTNLTYACMSSLLPFKIILFFENETALKEAIDDSSPLRASFTVVRRWSKYEKYMDRITWIECVGFHPKCWSYDNFMKLGEKWGKTLKVKYVENDVNSLTTATLLIRTNVQRRIEECIRLDHGNRGHVKFGLMRLEGVIIIGKT